MPRRPTLLVLSPLDVFPPSTGGASRIYNMLHALKGDFKLVLVCPPLRNPAAVNLDLKVHPIARGGRMQFLNLLFIYELHRIIRREKCPAMLVSFIWNIPAVLVARWPLRFPLYLDTHNVESERFGQHAPLIGHLIKIYERFCCRQTQKVLAVSERDRLLLQNLGIPAGQLTVLENGVCPNNFFPNSTAGEEFRKAHQITTSQKLFLFFGHLRYKPNIEAVEILTAEILPRLEQRGLDYRLAIAGEGSAELCSRYPHPQVKYLGVLQDIAAAINAADVVLVPLVSGAGTRIKILESLACGTPVVSTSIGATGLKLEVCGNLLQIATGWDDFAGKACTADRTTLASEFQQREFREFYGWSALGERLGQILGVSRNCSPP